MEIYNRFKGRCAYCGKPIKYEEMQVDHVIPLKKGGMDRMNNLAPACRMCNHYKSTYTLEQFRGQLGLLTERLKRSFDYRLAVKYNLTTEHNHQIKFYFEQIPELEEAVALAFIRSRLIE